MCTIHQPASQLYALFDAVLFLAGGRTAFLGTPSTGIRFFEEAGYPCPDNYNPADLIIHTLAIVPHEEASCQERIQAICNRFEEGEHGRALQQELDRAALDQAPLPRSRSKASVPTQISALLRRSALDNWRNPSLARSKIVQKTIMGEGRREGKGTQVSSSASFTCRLHSPKWASPI